MVPALLPGVLPPSLEYKLRPLYTHWYTKYMPYTRKSGKSGKNCNSIVAQGSMVNSSMREREAA